MNFPQKANISGVGAGLRSSHFEIFLNERPTIPWLEILADNFLHSQGILLEKLQAINQYYPMVLHSVGLSIGGTDPLDINYLAELKRLQKLTHAAWISDHLCWSHHQKIYSHELLPLPLTKECLKHVVQRIRYVQDYLQQQILIENISSYLQFSTDQMFEAEFLASVAEQADCLILLDVNNIYVNSQNHSFEATDYFDYLDSNRIKQIHLGGYTEQQETLIDTHGEAVHQPVWQLYQKTLGKFGAIATSIEWDNHIPAWPELKKQTEIAHDLWLHVSVGAQHVVP